MRNKCSLTWLVIKMNIIDEQKNTNSTARTKEQESEDSTGEEE